MSQKKKKTCAEINMNWCNLYRQRDHTRNSTQKKEEIDSDWWDLKDYAVVDKGCSLHKDTIKGMRRRR